MHDVLLHWVIKHNIDNTDMSIFLDDIKAVKNVRKGFSKRSNGILKEVVGAIDGQLVRVVQPSWKIYMCKNPVRYFLKKGSMP